MAFAIDKSNNLYLADADYNMIRMISPNGNITTVVGSQTAGYAGDGDFAFRAQLNMPMGVALDAQGSVYIADENNHRIRKVTPDGRIAAIAGGSHFTGDSGPATSAMLHRPAFAVQGPDGGLYISDSANNRIRKIDNKGVITTIAGTGECVRTGDRAKATTAGLCAPRGLAFDSKGNLFVADSGNYVVRRIDTNGVITTVAGTGKYADSGDSGAPLTIPMKMPYGIAIDSEDNIYVSDNIADRVRVLEGPLHQVSGYPNGYFALFAGSGATGFAGDGGLASGAKLTAPAHLATGPLGTVYIADSLNDRVRKVVGTAGGFNGVISTVLDSNSCCSGGTAFPLSGPEGIGLDAAGNLYVTWKSADVVTKTTVDGKTAIIAGTGNDDFSGDGGLALDSDWSGPLRHLGRRGGRPLRVRLLQQPHPEVDAEFAGQHDHGQRQQSERHARHTVVPAGGVVEFQRRSGDLRNSRNIYGDFGNGDAQPADHSDRCLRDRRGRAHSR